MTQISADEFAARLEAVCLHQGGRGLPRRLRDRQILFKSATLALSPRATYSEDEINAALLQWLDNVGRKIEIDHVSLRRHLIDNGYLKRDLAGDFYSLSFQAISNLFAPAVDTLNPAEVIAQALIRREIEKRDYLKKTRPNRPENGDG